MFFPDFLQAVKGHFHFSRSFGNLFVALLDWIGGSGVSSAVVVVHFSSFVVMVHFCFFPLRSLPAAGLSAALAHEAGDIANEVGFKGSVSSFGSSPCWLMLLAPLPGLALKS